MTRVGFIGVGRMGKALMTGFINKGLMNQEDILAFDKDKKRLDSAGVTAKYSAFEVVESSDVVFLCVKPADMGELLEEIGDVTGSRLVISIAAGVTIKRLEEKLNVARVVRVMPNTPALIQELAAGYSLGSKATEEDAVYVGSLLNSIGVAYRIDESLMDAVTGLSGSGPAYVYYLIDALSKAGEQQGLKPEQARNLAVQTFKGAVGMVQATGKDLDELIDEVRSPGGTTEKGLMVLEKQKVGKALAKAVDAAAKKSKKLGR